MLYWLAQGRLLPARLRIWGREVASARQRRDHASDGGLREERRHGHREGRQRDVEEEHAQQDVREQLPGERGPGGRRVLPQGQRGEQGRGEEEALHPPGQHPVRVVPTDTIG